MKIINMNIESNKNQIKKLVRIKVKILVIIKVKIINFD